MQRGRDFETSICQWGHHHQIAPIRVWGISHKKKQKEWKGQKGWRTSRKQGPLRQHDQSAYELTETEAT